MANEDQHDHWSGDGGDLWVAEQERIDAMLAPFLTDLLTALDPAPGERVLDVGCGNGALTRAVAARVAPGGEAVGVDLSPQMLAAARAAVDGEPARFVHADAQTADLGAQGGPFDAWTSRFGVMFFDDPGTAFANLAGALRPGGRVAFACWQDLGVNEWLMVPAAAVLEHVPPPEEPPAEGPGPFSLAEPDKVRSLLTGAGLVDVELTAANRPIRLGSSGADVASYLLRTGIAEALLGGADDATMAKATESVTAVLDERRGDGDVILDGAVWLVTARRP